ncbi:MAG: ATP-binding cassette domain-containing protein [Alphaproteobacteria bacterium]|nr:ATP-binding cassette domain-containing protein [Alphaproteobacteria bacterium]
MTGTLRLDGIRIRIAGRELLSLSATIGPGEVLTVMGPSGSGKSTLLAFIAGTLGPPFEAQGSVVLGTRTLDRSPPERRRIGILFQDDLLFPHLSVGGNLAFAIPPDIRERAERRARVEAALTEAGLEGFSDRDPATLSGGQRARVSALRVILSQPEALLLDEPFSKLDAALRDQFRNFVFGEVRRNRLPTVLVTHDPADAAAAGGQLVAIARA